MACLLQLISLQLTVIILTKAVDIDQMIVPTNLVSSSEIYFQLSNMFPFGDNVEDVVYISSQLFLSFDWSNLLLGLVRDDLFFFLNPSWQQNGTEGSKPGRN